MGDVLEPIALPIILGLFALAKGHLRLFGIGMAILLGGGAAAAVALAVAPESGADRVVVYSATVIGGLTYFVAAFRTAKPDSWWASRFYKTDKIARAEVKFSDSQEVRKKAQERITKAQESVTKSRYSHSCRACGEAFESHVAAKRHVERFHEHAAPEETVEIL